MRSLSARVGSRRPSVTLSISACAFRCLSGCIAMRTTNVSAVAAVCVVDDASLEVYKKSLWVHLLWKWQLNSKENAQEIVRLRKNERNVPPYKLPIAHMIISSLSSLNSFVVLSSCERRS